MLKTIAIASAFSLASLSANAELLDFDDIAVNTWSQYTSLTSYHGYDFTGGAALINKDRYKVSGYNYGAVSGQNALFDFYDKDIVITKTGGGLFDLNSAFMTAAWSNGLTINVSGWLNGQVVNSMDLVLNAVTPTAATQFNFLGVDKVVFGFKNMGVHANLQGSGSQFVIDNLELTSVAAVPEPSTYAMMFAGLGALGLMVRRRTLGN